MNAANVAEVVWYVTGRFYSSVPPSGPAQLEDVGYFLHLQGIEGKLFDGTPSEASARFTFASEPFTATTIVNGGLNIGVDTLGSFRLYLRDTPGATFDDPKSFAVGRCIAVLERVAIVPTTQIADGNMTFLSNVFTARLVSTEPFEFDGIVYDLRELIGYGVTQWGTAVTEPLIAPSGYSGVVPFAASAIRVATT